MIRVAAPADHEALLDLWEALMANGAAADPRFAATPDARQHMRAWTRDTWFDVRPFPRVLVWDEDGLQAFVHGFPRSALPVVDLAPTVRIGDLYVAPGARRRGIGRSLVEDLIDRAREAGFPRAEVGTLTHDEAAVAFWRHMGFSAWQVHFSRIG